MLNISNEMTTTSQEPHFLWRHYFQLEHLNISRTKSKLDDESSKREFKNIFINICKTMKQIDISRHVPAQENLTQHLTLTGENIIFLKAT